MSCSAPSTNSTRDRALESLRELETTLTTISKTLALEVEKLKITEVHIQILSPSRQPQKPAYLT
jgi:hypothetical protein